MDLDNRKSEARNDLKRLDIQVEVSISIIYLSSNTLIHQRPGILRRY